MFETDKMGKQKSELGHFAKTATDSRGKTVSKMLKWSGQSKISNNLKTPTMTTWCTSTEQIFINQNIINIYIDERVNEREREMFIHKSHLACWWLLSYRFRCCCWFHKCLAFTTSFGFAFVFRLCRATVLSVLVLFSLIQFRDLHVQIFTRSGQAVGLDILHLKKKKKKETTTLIQIWTESGNVDETRLKIDHWWTSEMVSLRYNRKCEPNWK